MSDVLQLLCIPCVLVSELWIPVLKAVGYQAGLFSRVLEVLGSVFVQKADLQWTQCLPTMFNDWHAHVFIYNLGLYHRITEWIGLEGSLKISWTQNYRCYISWEVITSHESRGEALAMLPTLLWMQTRTHLASWAIAGAGWASCQTAPPGFPPSIFVRSNLCLNFVGSKILLAS